ncbi:MAG: rRNA pseudouridine synthase [Bdellovibrionales bacterium]|nr:rRNA pseudouridine synthase [Bdellovibrionales bacterium]
MPKTTAKKSGSKQSGRVSLTRALSKLGFASRTEAGQLIKSGLVKVHGSVEKNPARRVNPDTAHIEVAGAKIKKEGRIVVIFHKPKGVLTTKRDPEGRETIYDLLPEGLHSLHAVGRLDRHTTGLLLLTNDTQYSSYLTDPKNEVPRIYVVCVRGEFTIAQAVRATSGVEDDGETLIASSVEIAKSSGKESLLKITMFEGKNREIRRLCLSLGHEVISLKRIRYGEYELGSLKPGEYQILDIAASSKPAKL